MLTKTCQSQLYCCKRLILLNLEYLFQKWYFNDVGNRFLSKRGNEHAKAKTVVIIVDYDFSF